MIIQYQIDEKNTESCCYAGTQEPHLRGAACGRIEETKRIIDDLSLTIDGRFTVITGPNGGGDRRWPSSSWASSATSNRILLNGEDITDLSISERAKKASATVSNSPHASRA